MSNVLILGAISEATQAAILMYLPWALLAGAALGAVQWRRMNRAKRVQEITRGFAKMGSIKIVELGDAVSRGDIPAVVDWMKATAQEYQGERGALKFTWDVVKMGGDDLLKDAEYKHLFGKWIEEQIMGFIVDDNVQADLVKVGAVMARLHMEDSAALVDALSRDNVSNVKVALQNLVARFRDASKVEEEMVAWLVKAGPELVKNEANAIKLRAAFGVAAE